jgi:error-prone DNA polymerase
MPLGEHVAEDYSSLHLSLKAHPLALLRERMAALGYAPCASLAERPDGARVGVAGIVLVRQRPGTASGVIFATLEDETGIANVVIWSRMFERYRRVVLAARLMGVVGRLQREGIVIHLVAERLVDLTEHLAALRERPLPMDPPLARADEVKRPGQDARNRAVAGSAPASARRTSRHGIFIERGRCGPRADRCTNGRVRVTDQGANPYTCRRTVLSASALKP